MEVKQTIGRIREGSECGDEETERWMKELTERFSIDAFM